MHRKAESTVLAWTSRHSSYPVSTTGLAMRCETLLTSMSSRPKAGDGRLDQPLRLVWIADIGEVDAGPAARGLDLACDLAGGLDGFPAIDHHGRPGVGEGKRDRAADPAHASRNDGDLGLQFAPAHPPLRLSGSQ